MHLGSEKKAREKSHRWQGRKLDNDKKRAVYQTQATGDEEILEADAEMHIVFQEAIDI